MSTATSSSTVPVCKTDSGLTLPLMWGGAQASALASRPVDVWFAWPREHLDLDATPVAIVE